MQCGAADTRLSPLQCYQAAARTCIIHHNPPLRSFFMYSRNERKHLDNLAYQRCQEHLMQALLAKATGQPLHEGSM